MSRIRKNAPLNWEQLDKMKVGDKLNLPLPIPDFVLARNSITSYKNNKRGFGKDFSSAKGEKVASGVFVLEITRTE